MKCPAIDKRHLAISIASAYLIAAAAVAHIITQSMETIELATPPLCMHTPFAGISHIAMLGPPLRANRFLGCALNSTVRIFDTKDVNMTGLSMANIYHLSTLDQGDVSIHSLLQASLFFSFLDVLRSIAPGTRVLILDESAIVEPDPRWRKVHTMAMGLHFDVMRLEPCGGMLEASDGPIRLNRCTQRCFNPGSPSSAIVSYNGAKKMLDYAMREHQAYPATWFYGLVRMMDPSFALFCLDGLNAHNDAEWKRARKGML